ncbi:hypothetical protein GCM10027084_05960 [Pseudoxanthomonas sangjuensis]
MLSDTAEDVEVSIATRRRMQKPFVGWESIPSEADAWNAECACNAWPGIPESGRLAKRIRPE